MFVHILTNWEIIPLSGTPESECFFLLQALFIPCFLVTLNLAALTFYVTNYHPIAFTNLSIHPVFQNIFYL